MARELPRVVRAGNPKCGTIYLLHNRLNAVLEHDNTTDVASDVPLSGFARWKSRVTASTSGAIRMLGSRFFVKPKSLKAAGAER